MTCARFASTSVLCCVFGSALGQQAPVPYAWYSTNSHQYGRVDWYINLNYPTRIESAVGNCDVEASLDQVNPPPGEGGYDFVEHRYGHFITAGPGATGAFYLWGGPLIAGTRDANAWATTDAGGVDARSSRAFAADRFSDYMLNTRSEACAYVSAHYVIDAPPGAIIQGTISIAAESSFSGLTVESHSCEEPWPEAGPIPTDAHDLGLWFGAFAEVDPCFAFGIDDGNVALRGGEVLALTGVMQDIHPSVSVVDPPPSNCGGGATETGDWVSSGAPLRSVSYIFQLPLGTRRFMITTRAGALCGGGGSLTECYTPACPADLNQDGGIDGDDVIAFFAYWDSGDLRADLNGDGTVDGDDVVLFFALFDQGCLG